MEQPDFVKEILYNKHKVEHWCWYVFHQIKSRYFERNDNPLSPEDIIVLVVMNGGKYFSDFLFQETSLGKYDMFKIYYITASSYENNKKLPRDEIKLDFSGVPDLEKKCVLVVDDIYDSGNTLKAINAELENRKVKNVENVVLINRIGHHKHHVPILAYALQVTTDDYLVGYGLDYNGAYRDLPYVASVKGK